MLPEEKTARGERDKRRRETMRSTLGDIHITLADTYAYTTIRVINRPLHSQ